MNVKTIYPSSQPSFNEWCKMFNVSSRYEDRTPITNANRIMSLWDGYSKMKEIFILKTKTL